MKRASWTPEIVVFCITLCITGIVTWITEGMLPRIFEMPNRQGEKHLWSALLAFATMISGTLISFLLGIDRAIKARLNNLWGRLDAIVNKEIQGEFEALLTVYHSRLTKPGFVIGSWTKEALAELRRDMEKGFIPLPRHVLKTEFGKIYHKAHRHIVATNVGSTNFYFHHDGNYGFHNRTAVTSNRVAVVRFYLFSAKQKIELRDSSQSPTLDQFREEVENLHNHLLSVCSVIIDLDFKFSPEPRDFLMVDSQFVAETLTHHWEFIRALGSEDEDVLTDACTYFSSLWGVMRSRNDHKNVFWMPDDQVRKHYPEYLNTTPGNGQKLADIIFTKVMEEVEAKSLSGNRPTPDPLIHLRR